MLTHLLSFIIIFTVPSKNAQEAREKKGGRGEGNALTCEKH